MKLVVVLCLVWISSFVAAQEWWKTAIFYQIYPRSFKDSDNSGVGDIPGITSKVDYLADIGVNAVWLSPIYKSPMADFGYDISNFTDVDPLFGSMADLLELIGALKNRNMYIVLDFVPNHSSDEHPYFNMSVNKQGEYTDYYVWKDRKTGSNTSNPQEPNNWRGVFSGSAWEWNTVRQQYYLHQFVAKQPDLNYRNSKVVQDMKENIQFWLDQGVDGFRVDAVKHLVEDDRFLDEPLLVNGSDPLVYDNLDHVYTTNQDLTLEIIAGWSELISAQSRKDSRQRILLLEVYNTIDITMKYYGNSSFPFQQPFNFHLLEAIAEGMTAVDMLTSINDWLSKMTKERIPNWAVGNHDNSRVATRGGTEFVDSMNMILAMLPGIMITYNGDELGMTDTYLRFDETVDPSGTLLGPDDYATGTRDPERTPLQWDDTVNAGFCTNKTWLPVNPNYWRLNAAMQNASMKSHLKVYKSLSRLRRSTTFLSNTTQYAVSAPNNDTFIIRRWSNEGDTYVLIVNFASTITTTTYSLTNVTQMMVYASSINAEYSAGDIVNITAGVTLRPKAGVVLQTTMYTAVSSASSLTMSFTLLFALLCSMLFGQQLQPNSAVCNILMIY